MTEFVAQTVLALCFVAGGRHLVKSSRLDYDKVDYAIGLLLYALAVALIFSLIIGA